MGKLQASVMRLPRRATLERNTWVCPRCRALSTSSRRSLLQRRSTQTLPSTPARTRFAPSPTGYLHLGSLRTALFNYLTAKATGGQFILRLENTDEKRTVEDAESRLYHDLSWAGLQWDEGPDIGGPCGPYKQSERTTLYKGHATQLLESGHAYRCFCSAARLNKLARERIKLGAPSDYDRACGSISREESDERAFNRESHVVRLKMPDVPPQFTDLVYGVVGQARGAKKSQLQRVQLSYEDPILIKSDGRPTYHLANVVDDHHMGITHVIRATEWMSSTPKHMIMYNAFNWEPPAFAHVGLLTNPDLQKFSKRQSALSVHSLAEEGYFAETLINFVALFGWSHKLGHDHLSLSDLTKHWDLKFTKGNTIASPTKLAYLQRHYASKYVQQGGERFDVMVDNVVAVAQQHLEQYPEQRFCADEDLRQRTAALLRSSAAKYVTPQDFFASHSYFLCFSRKSEIPQSLSHEFLKNSIDVIKNQFYGISIDNWDEAHLIEVFNRFVIALSKDWPAGSDQATAGTQTCKSELQHFLRWAMTDKGHGPGLMLTMSLLGRDVSLHRIEGAAAVLDAISREDQAVSSSS